MSEKILVFYANRLYAECASYADFRLLHLQLNAELYNGAYLFVRANWIRGTNYAWYRADNTPLLEADVPRTLKTLVLLLGG
jgi:hypothetical protein